MIPLTALPTENAIPTSDVAGVILAGVPVAAPVAALLAEEADETTAEALEATLEALTEAADVPAAEADEDAVGTGPLVPPVGETEGVTTLALTAAAAYADSVSLPEGLSAKTIPLGQ